MSMTLNDALYLANQDKKFIAELSGSNYLYVGYAFPGTETTAARWQIRKLTYSGDTPILIEFAGGSADFVNVWNDRASLDYS